MRPLVTPLKDQERQCPHLEKTVLAGMVAKFKAVVFRGLIVYLATVLLLMAVLPIGSIAIEYFNFHSSLPLMLLMGKWFVFWGAGIRLFLAGLRQFFQPRFTAEEIFHIKSDDALPLVRELGVANLATGVAGITSLAKPSFVPPVALIAAIFYGVAGIRHATDKGRSLNQNIALISDLFIFLVFAAYLGFVALA